MGMGIEYVDVGFFRAACGELGEGTGNAALLCIPTSSPHYPEELV